MPEWIIKFKNEGLTDNEINEIIKGKTEKYVGKWGNTSKVGVLINNYDSARIASEQLVMNPRNQAARSRATAHNSMMTSPKAASKRMSSLPAIQHRNSANPAKRTKSIAVRGKSNQTQNLRNSQRTSAFNTMDDYDHYTTTNQHHHDVLEQQDFSAVKKNFKKKTPFTQWSNAYFSGGVFFNPPVSGI